jgi:serine/threonine-protein kinase
MSPQIDTIAGRYLLESKVSQGGMATVWRARDDVLARPVAVKILHPHLSEDHAFLERFRREALAAARLSHPNIVSIYDTGTEPAADGAPDLQYIVMEHCGGGTLADMAGETGAASPDRVISIGRAICDALAYAHRQDIVHRDVKPANVLIADDGLLKVADFGIAKAAFVKGDITTTGSILGTVTYISPEQAQGNEPDQRSDLYGLGVVLYELLVGRPPFAGETQIATAMKHLKEQPPPLRSIKAGVPRALEGVIMKALAKDPNERYASADEMRVALEGAGGRSPGTIAIQRPLPSPGAESRARSSTAGDTRWIVKVILAVAAVVALAILTSSLVDEAADDSPPSGNGGRGNGGGAAALVEVQNVSDFDPYGGDGEHPEEAPLSIDGDASTSWTTQTYSADLATLGKPGVGLVFDLGEEPDISGATITGSAGMDLEVRAGDSCEGDESSFQIVSTLKGFSGEADLSFESTSARCWLVWITRLSEDGGGRAALAEVEFLGG